MTLCEEQVEKVKQLTVKIKDINEDLNLRMQELRDLLSKNEELATIK